jgi:outer membrane murein-binding lipoprotein Lpp
MDSNEAANAAIIKSHRLHVWLVIIAVPALVASVVAAYFSAYPREPSHASLPGGAVMVTGWVPVVLLLSGSTVIAVALLITALRRWKNKRLKSEVSDLTTLVTNLKDERQDAWDREAAANKAALEANQRADDADKEKEKIDALFQDRDRQLAEWNWLTSRATKQAEHISEYVVIAKVKPGTLLFSGERGAILELMIRNESVCDVTIQGDKIKGRFQFKHKELCDPAEFDALSGRELIVNLAPMEEKPLALSQPFLKGEAERIEEALADEKACFWLGSLRIPIFVEKVREQPADNILRFKDEVRDAYLKDFKRTE